MTPRRRSHFVCVGETDTWNLRRLQDEMPVCFVSIRLRRFGKLANAVSESISIHVYGDVWNGGGGDCLGDLKKKEMKWPTCLSEKEKEREGNRGVVKKEKPETNRTNGGWRMWGGSRVGLGDRGGREKETKKKKQGKEQRSNVARRGDRRCLIPRRKLPAREEHG